MKLTEMQLLQAIGQADEKTVNRTAPRQPEETGRLPIRIRRRALEMIAVCAALCIFVGGGFLIRNLRGSQVPLTSYADDETAAREVLEQFLEACKNGDREKILEYSLIKVTCRVMDDPEQAEAEIQEYVDALSGIKDYQIGESEDLTDRLDSIRQNERDQSDLRIYELESQGMHKEAEQYRQHSNACLDYFNRTDKMFGFHIILSISHEESGDSAEETEHLFQVKRYDGKWYADPVEYGVSPLSEKSRQKLENFRANDPDYHEGTEQPVQTETPAEHSYQDNTPDEQAAGAALSKFLALCTTGDADAIRQNCLLEQLTALTGTDYAEQMKNLTEKKLTGIIKYGYEIEMSDASEQLKEQKSNAKRYQWYDAWQLDAEGKTAEAKTLLAEPYPLTEFWEQFTDMKCTFIKEAADSAEKVTDFGMMFYVGKSQGEWVALPFLFQRPDVDNLSDADMNALTEYIRQDQNLPENDLPEYENNAKWKTWSTADTKKAEQQFSGGEIRAGMPVIELTEAKLPPAGGTALSLLVGPEYTVPYTVSFDFRMPDASPGVLSFVTCYGTNTVPDDEPYGEQRYWYKLQPNGMISYETSFGHGSEEFRGFLEKNASEQCFDPKKWNTMSLKTTETGTEVFINGVFAASLPDPNGMRSDLTGRLALDGAEGMMLRHFVFEDGIS